MQFIYHNEAGNPTLTIENELYKYLFKVRRHAPNDLIEFRNLNDAMLYTYKVLEVSKRYALLQYIQKKQKELVPQKKLHLAWCVVDSKTIEKELPYLNELGVDKISFVYADYSQKNFKLHFEKYNKILINSSQQCGRSSLIEFDTFMSVDDFLKTHPNSFMFNFSNQHIQEQKQNIETIIVGCEGGFSQREVALFHQDNIVGVDSNLILRSETAALSVCAKLLI